jgi:type III secretion system low calcium response chaperone LcrH/SycD
LTVTKDHPEGEQIVDLDFFNRPDIAKDVERGIQMAMQALADNGLDQDPRLLAVLDGQTIAQAKGLSRADLEVLYAYGFSFISKGDTRKAEDVFSQLCMIDPLVAKNHYCLGIVRQMTQHWDLAIDDFARFCALDATNPEGYLRIGECLTAKGDRAEARKVFDVALREARKGHGPANAAEQAERALATLGKGD